jgi:hypothetical protein
VWNNANRKSDNDQLEALEAKLTAKLQLAIDKQTVRADGLEHGLKELSKLTSEDREERKRDSERLRQLDLALSTQSTMLMATLRSMQSQLDTIMKWQAAHSDSDSPEQRLSALTINAMADDSRLELAAGASSYASKQTQPMRLNLTQSQYISESSLLLPLDYRPGSPEPVSAFAHPSSTASRQPSQAHSSSSTASSSSPLLQSPLLTAASAQPMPSTTSASSFSLNAMLALPGYHLDSAGHLVGPNHSPQERLGASPNQPLLTSASSHESKDHRLQATQSSAPTSS